MTDKEKIRAEIERLLNIENEWMNKQGFTDVHMGMRTAYQNLLSFIDSLQEEPVSEDLEEAADSYIKTHGEILGFGRKTFKTGSEWKEKQMMAKAIDGTARPDDNEIWCSLASSNLKDGDKVKIIVIRED